MRNAENRPKPASRPKRRFDTPTLTYVFTVAAVGLATVISSVFELSHQLPEQGWLNLCGLTLICGWLSVKLPSGLATISISETFVLSGTLLYGPSAGTILVVLDALVLCLKEGWQAKQLRWQQVLFNAAAPAASIWTAAHLVGINKELVATAVGEGLGLRFVVNLAAFTLLYFLFNSFLISVAIALERKIAPLKVWSSNFKELSLNFGASASIAAFVVSTKVNFAFIGIIVPLLVVVYFTYRWSNERVLSERNKNDQLNRVFLSTVEALALAIDAKDQVTHGHIRRVQRHTMALAKGLGIKDEKILDAIRAAALLHDTGKLAVPEYILNKPGPLSASEFERMKVHAAVGADILKSIDFPYPVEPIVRHHHENWNGTGYPAGLRGQQIPLGARILSVVDCYDALTSDRPYRPRYTRQQAEQILRERKGTMYDPWVVDGFLAILDQLESADTEEQILHATETSPAPLGPAQFEVIAATQAEEREFNELQRELPRATSFQQAAETLVRHARRVVPSECLAVYVGTKDSDDLGVVACAGSGAAAVTGMTIRIGERITGWAAAHRQVVVNSDATLDLGPMAKTLSTPLRYALSVPVLTTGISVVITAYGSEPFAMEHRRMLETAATLFASTQTSGGMTSDPARSDGAAPKAQTQERRVH